MKTYQGNQGVEEIRTWVLVNLCCFPVFQHHLYMPMQAPGKEYQHRPFRWWHSGKVSVRVLGGDDADLVSYQPLEEHPGVLIGKHGAKIPYHLHHANGDEECMGIVRVTGSKPGLPVVQLSDKLVFGPVDAVHGAVVEQGGLPFSVIPHLNRFSISS